MVPGGRGPGAGGSEQKALADVRTICSSWGKDQLAAEVRAQKEARVIARRDQGGPAAARHRGRLRIFPAIV